MVLKIEELYLKKDLSTVVLLIILKVERLSFHICLFLFLFYINQLNLFLLLFIIKDIALMIIFVWNLKIFALQNFLFSSKSLRSLENSICNLQRAKQEFVPYI